jgi:hypothetical protein
VSPRDRQSGRLPDEGVRHAPACSRGGHRPR